MTKYHAIVKEIKTGEIVEDIPCQDEKEAHEVKRGMMINGNTRGFVFLVQQEPKYNIIRFYADSNKERKIMYKGLSLDEAKAHCSLESTRLEGVWFEGFEAQ